MAASNKAWARSLASLSVRRPWWLLAALVLLTLLAGYGAEHLEMRLNFTDLLPEDNEPSDRYREVMQTFPESSIIIVLEGERNAMVDFAQEIAPVLPTLDGLYNALPKMPVEWMADHGFALQEADDFERSLRLYQDPSLLGNLRGLNDDFEREYTDNEDNLKSDELQVARSLLGLAQGLEVLDANLSGSPSARPLAEAVWAMSLGEPWQLSLDRHMMMMPLYPEATSFRETEAMLATTRRVMATVDSLATAHPEVRVGYTGMGPIGLSEMNSIGPYTYWLMLLAMLLIYLLLARAFHGWVLPIIALMPLIGGIVWTMGLVQLLFGSVNIFTVMMALVLLGLGIDFTIHLLSRFTEERADGSELEQALAVTLSDTGTGVLTGALTTAAAFFALMIANTTGVFEFGAVAGSGVLLTLLSVFFTLPPLLVLRDRFMQRYASKLRPPRSARHGSPTLGRIAHSSYRHAWWFLAAFALIASASLWAAEHISFVYDWMKLEPQDARSVQLQSELPERFGNSDQAGWIVHSSVEEARRAKEQLEDLSAIAEVAAISDFIPPKQRLEAYRPQVDAFRRQLESQPPRGWRSGDEQALAHEITRLWDNLDLMSNLAFQAGIDRVVKVIDTITGYDSEADSYDSTAALPALSRHVNAGLAPGAGQATAEAWEAELRSLLLRMSNTDEISVADLPDELRLSFLPRKDLKQDRYLTQVLPRGYAWSKKSIQRFLDQVKPVAPEMTSTQEIFLVMIDETLRDGLAGSLLALAVIAVLLLIHFRGFTGWLAMVPLAGSALMMLGTMYIFGIDYNYMNLIALPIILGIGIDDGVHALHRWRHQRGQGGERIEGSYRHVGRAIGLTSATTMIGFGSIGFYKMPAMSSFGTVLFMGVGYCFVATLLVLPALLRLLPVAKCTGEEEAS